jgi:hypothetical protein
MLARARQIDREVQLGEPQDRFHAMWSRHLEIANKLVERTRQSVDQQLERVRRRAEIGADTTVSLELLATLESALARRITYREQLSGTTPLQAECVAEDPPEHQPGVSGTMVTVTGADHEKARGTLRGPGDD